MCGSGREALNELLKEGGEPAPDLETLVRRTGHEPEKIKLFDNAAQTWNHTFFWTCMSPNRTSPDGKLGEAIERAFGGPEGLRDTFVKEGGAHFGSGWVWLAADREALRVLTTHDADDALTHDGMIPLLTCDLWEHAYYLDYQNEREGFLEAWFDSLPNWDFAAAQFAAAMGSGPPWKHPGPN